MVEHKAERILLEDVKRLTTTDGTITTVITYPVKDDSVVGIEAWMLGRRTDVDGRAFYIRKANVFREAAGSATFLGQVDTTLTRESSGGYNATMTVSGNNLLLQVQGNAGQTLNWKVYYRLLEVV